jgi:hypothetical protein
MKTLGAIYTPKEYAKILSDWAIRSKSDTILDLGVGKGVFVFQAFERLKKLGAKKPEAMNQIFGSEINKTTFYEFLEEERLRNCHFINIKNEDFFQYSFPMVNAIIGNPPYVRRRSMNESEVNIFRKKTLQSNSEINNKDLFALTDLYVYFLLTALPSLLPGGRVAVILADTWLNARYGSLFKKYLLSEFCVNKIISLDRSIFQDAQVKAVIILASKNENSDDGKKSITFSRIKNGLPICKLSSYIHKNIISNDEDIFINVVKPSSLVNNAPWSELFRSSKLMSSIREKPIVKPFNEVAKMQIGLQTLAKDFFVISKEQIKRGIVEKNNTMPFAYSVSDFNKQIIDEDDDVQEFVFYCSSSKKDIAGTKTLEYILAGENKEVIVKGKGISVVGYQNKKRIQDAKRPFWYDIKTEIEKKEIAEILLPRFIYKEYSVLWNKAKYIPGGAIVQYFPLNKKQIDVRVSLAVLKSTFSEIVFRLSSQIYGGGTTNVRISDIKNAPTIDISQLSEVQQENLINAYEKDLFTKKRDNIDVVVNKILELDSEGVKQLNNLLADLVNLTLVSRKAAHPDV